MNVCVGEEVFGMGKKKQTKSLWGSEVVIAALEKKEIAWMVCVCFFMLKNFVW